jgi:hypothetical protein
MSNSCWNTISICGEPDRLKAFDKQFRKKHKVYKQYELANADKCKIYKNLIQANPGLEFCGDTEYGYITTEDRGYSFENFAPKLTREEIIGWYNFNNKNWGVRSDIDKESFNVCRDDIEKDWIYYNFTTAWCDCKEIVEKMSKQFPDLEFIYNFEEDQEELAGTYKYKGGEITESYDYNDFQDYGYKEFKCDYLGAEYLKCEDCGCYIEEEAFEGECPECESKNILGIDHKTRLEVK